jgi:hypothetical protein
MKIQFDTYTKAVLTIICLCLLWLSLKDVSVLRHVQAAGPMEVRVSGRLVVDPSGGYLIVRGPAGGSVPVHVSGSIGGQ